MIRTSVLIFLVSFSLVGYSKNLVLLDTGLNQDKNSQATVTKQLCFSIEDDFVYQDNVSAANLDTHN